MPVELAVDGWSNERIRDSYPTLSEEDISACLRYAAAPLREERRFALAAA